MQRRRIRVTMLMIQDILIKAMISSFCESMYLSYFRFQSNAWQNEGDIFTHKSHNEEGASFFFLFICFLKKKLVLLESKSLIKNYPSFTADSINLCEKQTALSTVEQIRIVFYLIQWRDVNTRLLMLSLPLHCQF